MIPPRWFLPYDVMIQLITAFVALAVGLFAYRGFALIRDRTFKALSIAFVLLSMGFFIKGLALAMAWAYGVGYAEHGALVNVSEPRVLVVLHIEHSRLWNTGIYLL